VVGSSSQFVDTSGSAIQVLGTPSFPVEFTSLNDTPLNGDWGGIVVRNDVDNVTEGHFRYEDQGIFLNYINFADMQYGGGIVSNGFIDAVISPITIVDARPTVTNNRLTNNSDAAIAASPNSFLESNFRDPGSQSQQAGGFTLDYGRVGPMVQSNLVVGNTINGMVIGDRFRAPSESNIMTVAGRWDDTSITHVLQDSLQIVGNSGGNSTEVIDVGGVETLREIGRPDASLVIDPATVVKLDSVAISVDVGATLLAEGTEVRPVVVTSLQDSRYGAGGTYTTSEGEAASGDWGGIYIAPTAIASFDHAILAYGGGVVTVPGTFTGINVVESHQGDLRITNSLFELNANGIGGAASEDRGGLGLHEAATVFVSGSQPVIIDNAFRGNEAAIVSINVNSLNHFVVTDRGRSRGPVDASNRYQDNLGPLVRNNQMDDNAINGMVVRGGTLTTESTWDDTDVVHVVLDSIFVPTFHSYGGLRLKSSIDSSLVVKLLDAEIVATGSTAGVADFIGGGVQVLGQLGRPVVMTSFFDDTVGAGFDSEGRTVVDTDGGRRPMRTSDGFDIQLNFGPAISADPEIMAAAELAASIWEAQIQDPITVSIDVDLYQPADPTRQCLLAFTAVCGDYTPNYTEINNDVDLFDTDAVFLNDITYSTFRDAAIADAGAHEALIGQLPTAGELQVDLPFDSLDPYSFSGNTVLSTANAKALNLATTSPEQSVYVPGAERDGTILINQNRKNWDFDTRNGLSTYREDFQSNFLREIGKILGFNSSFDTVAFTPQRDIDLAPLDLFRFDAGEGIADFTNAVRRLDPTDTTNKVFYAGGDLDFTDFPVEGISLGEIPISTSQTLGGSSWTEEL
ncbi:MAG: NF038122 family metalloprotease, partial [Planctomycetota bacterium]